MIRPATKHDAAEIRRLSEILGYPIATVEEASKRIEFVFSRPEDRLWAAVQNATVVGWIHCSIRCPVMSSPYVEIIGLVVDTDQRGRGFGRSLVDKARIWAEEQDLELRVRCNVKRTETHDFYKKVGFQEMKSQKVFSIQSSASE